MYSLVDCVLACAVGIRLRVKVLGHIASFAKHSNVVDVQGTILDLNHFYLNCFIFPLKAFNPKYAYKGIVDAS